MPSVTLPAARGGLGLVALALMSNLTMAQEPFRFGGSLSMVEVHDDNLFSAPESREPDDIGRLSPRLRLTRRSPRLALSGRYGLDAEKFRRHPSLDTPLAAQDATLELTWTASRRLTASATAAYAEAQSPGALNTLTGLELGRREGRRLSTTESLSWRIGARTTGTVEQSFMREDVVAIPRTDTQTVGLGLERRLGPVDRVRVSYSARRFGSREELILSHVLTLRWSREVTPLAHFEFEAGPRLSGHTLGAEVSAALKHRFHDGEAGVAYVHTQTTILGETGPVMADGLTATFKRQLGEAFTVAGGPAFYRVQGRGPEIAVHRLDLEVAWRLSGQLSLAASRQFSLQRGVPGLERADAQIVRNTLLLRAVASAGN
jgi:hypothetical protein